MYLSAATSFVFTAFFTAQLGSSVCIQLLNWQLFIRGKTFTNKFDILFTPFGTYTGEVTSIQGEKMTIEVTSPTGKGNMWVEYEIEGTLWKKQGGDK